LKITAHKTRAVLLGLLTVSVLIGFATVYVLPNHGLAIRVIGTGLAGLAVATALFFLLRTLGAFTVFEAIRERQQTERTLANSQQRLADILWGTGAGTWEWNVQTGETRRNERWAELIGYRLDTLAAVSIKTWRELVHPDDLAHAQTVLEQHFRGEREYYEAEIRLRHRSGEWIWVLDRGRVITRTESGQPEWMAGIHLDITDHKQAEQHLRESKARLELFFSQSLSGFFFMMLDKPISWHQATSEEKEPLLDYVMAHLHMTQVNPAMLSQYGAQEDDFIGLTPNDLFAHDLEHGRQVLRQVIEQGHWHTQTRERRLDGTPIIIEGDYTCLYDEQGRVTGHFGIQTDITERQRTEDRLKLAASVFEHANEGITITDADANIIEVNRAFTRITGYRREEVLGQNPRILQSGHHTKAFYEQMWQMLQTQGSWIGEIWNRRKTGDVYAELKTISAVYDAQGQVQHYIALFLDISAQKDYQQQLERIAHYDALTGLPNRVLLADRLRQAMAQTERRGKQIAVACLDLDEFKSVNDVYGHETGDQLLVRLAQRMQHVLRESDTLARSEGDEFIILLNDITHIAACVSLLQRLLDIIAAPQHDQGRWLQVSASVGVSLYPQAEPVDADQLLRQAGQAMYQAKLAGKNGYHLFDTEHDRQLRDHHGERERIRQALAHQEFMLYYQPKVDMRTGTVIGTEALIRWQHPERGLLAPGAFLPFIDQHPLMVDLGDWVIETALAQISAWRAAGLVLPVSVNVDALQLAQTDFIAKLGEALDRYPEVPPSDLELEILETSALADIAEVSDILHAGQAMDVSFALDDFGTGYSSLSYLKRLPVETIKIDQSFVRDMLDDPNDLAILKGIISLAEAFGRKVIAEGVETDVHSERLLELGCKLGQGYAIGRPMPATQIPSWCACYQEHGNK